MNKKLRFIWFDDRPERKAESTNLEARLNVSCRFINLRNKTLNAEINTVLAGRQPDLILMDHKLENTASGIFKTGSTAAAYIHEKWPQCPILGITAVDIEDIDTRQLSMYDAIFPITKISRYDQEFISIAESFNVIKKRRLRTTAGVLKLLKSPKIEKNRLVAVFPKELKENFSNKSLAREICRWVRSTLIARPGFLYDPLWSATLLGIKEESFKKAESLFESAKYDGVFASDATKRWWKSGLLDILSTKVKSPGLPWEKGRKLMEFDKKDFSKCYVTKDDFPETVAFVDQAQKSRRVQIKLSETVPHPNFEDLLYFEEIRMMKSAE